jgi:hypothetical protein
MDQRHGARACAGGDQGPIGDISITQAALPIIVVVATAVGAAFDNIVAVVGAAFVIDAVVFNR